MVFDAVGDGEVGAMVAGLGVETSRQSAAGPVCAVVLLQSPELRVCHECREDLIM